MLQMKSAVKLNVLSIKPASKDTNRDSKKSAQMGSCSQSREEGHHCMLQMKSASKHSALHIERPRKEADKDSKKVN